jgi:hypothetical protein
MAAEIQRRLFTVDDCYKMVEAGILRPHERVELIRGELIKMSPIGTRHAAAVDRATRAFVRLVGCRSGLESLHPFHFDEVRFPGHTEGSATGNNDVLPGLDVPGATGGIH